MEEMYDKINACSSSSMAQADDISLFLHQILLRSSSASVAAAPGNLSRPYQPERGGEISSAVADSLAINASSSSPVGLSETENDEYDCDSEEGLEALVESAKTSIPRGSSKRSRAAEVHNMSEKRRRSRINEKMKALQNLIPNSNKTDKASMLDEAIEYLKQLQLKVQMLAMRNGLSMRPISVPEELLSQMRMDHEEEEKSMHQSAMCSLPQNQEIPATQIPFSLPNQCNSSDRRFPPNMLNTGNSDASIGFKPPAIPHLGAYQLQTSSENICRGNGVRNQLTTETSNLEFGIGDMSAIGSFHGQSFDLKGNGSAEMRIGEGEWSESVLLKAMEQNLIHPSHLNSMRTG